MVAKPYDMGLMINPVLDPAGLRLMAKTTGSYFFGQDKDVEMKVLDKEGFIGQKFEVPRESTSPKFIQDTALEWL